MGSKRHNAISIERTECSVRKRLCSNMSVIDDGFTAQPRYLTSEIGVGVVWLRCECIDLECIVVGAANGSSAPICPV